MKYHILVFGCQFNKSDAEKISQLLEKKGYKQSPTAIGADLVIILACSVRQKSVDKIKNLITRLRSASYGGRRNQKAKIILTGCILKDDKKQFEQMGVEIKKFKDIERFPPISGLITIGKGCNNFCSYCVVPYTRGREKYRPQTAIIREAKHLIKNGVKEITLVAQNVNSYPNFVSLLQKITKLPGDFKVKFLTNHPKDFSEALIDEMAKNPKIIKYVHLPFQAGDNAILKKMNRHYTRADYLKLIAKIKKAMPEVVITTDIIVGFPGETKAQFAKTIEVIKKVGFKQAFIAKYSSRPGTAAYKLKDDMSMTEKAQREQILRKLLPENNLTELSLVRPVKVFTGLTSEKLVVILGPTASGKTDLALKLAKSPALSKIEGFNGVEIVCADSRQIYSEMAIGTASPFQNLNLRGSIPRRTYGGPSPASSVRYRGVVHHLFNFLPPNKPLNVALYQRLAIKAIKDIQKRGKVPFLVGGTAFYIYSVVEGWQFPKSKANKGLRKKLESKSASQLFKTLKNLDIIRAKNIDKNNKRRLIRAIEMAKEFGKVPQMQKNPLFDCLILGIKTSQQGLAKRIEKRTEKMFKQGLEKEVKALTKKYGWTSVLKNAIGYSEWKGLSSFVDRRSLAPSEIKNEVKNLISLHTRQLTKKQMTWFKKDRRILWVKNYQEAVHKVSAFAKN